MLVVVFALAKSGARDTAKTPLLDQPAPAVRATTIDGQPFDLSQRKGSWVVLNFFGTWCPPCVQEHPELLRFATAQAQQPDGAELVTVVNNDDRRQRAGTSSPRTAATGRCCRTRTARST